VYAQSAVTGRPLLHFSEDDAFPLFTRTWRGSAVETELHIDREIIVRIIYKCRL
jgi:hypothetical protein